MSVTLHFPTSIGDEDIAELSKRNPGYRFERSREGQLIVSPTGSQGGARNSKLAWQLQDWSRRAGLGECFDSSTGFTLPDGSLLSPDGAWIRRDRWEALTGDERERYAPLCPDVVFELRSRTDSEAELLAKARAYLANGATLAVAVDPYARRVYLLRPNREDERFDDAARVACDPELPGFTLHTADFFC